MGAIGATFALASCSVGSLHLPGRAPSLPSLTSTQELRELAARTEAAALERARSLAEDATACAQCVEVLNSLAEVSQERLATLGGLWDPWQGNAPEGAHSVPALPSAPVTVTDFALWLSRTAKRDLAHAIDPQLTSPDQAKTLASIALGRARSALAIAEVYGIDLDGDASELQVLSQRVDTLGASASLPTLASWGLSADSFPHSSLSSADLASAKGLDKSPELSAAIASWDCTAQSLPKAQLIDASVDDATFGQDLLFSRIDTLVSHGVPDTRTARCQVSDRSAQGLAKGLIAADFSLLSSNEADVRMIGMSAALEDLQAFPIGSHAYLPALIGATRSDTSTAP